LSNAIGKKREQTKTLPSKERIQMPLLQYGTAILLELPMWVPDMRSLPEGEQMGYDQWAHMDMS
jgi:hypothetical protein